MAILENKGSIRCIGYFTIHCRYLLGLREEELDGILLVHVPLGSGPLEPVSVINQPENLSTLETAQGLVLLQVVPQDLVVARASTTCKVHTQTHVMRTKIASVRSSIEASSLMALRIAY
jgi:hypothetical protein